MVSNSSGLSKGSQKQRLPHTRETKLESTNIFREICMKEKSIDSESLTAEGGGSIGRGRVKGRGEEENGGLFEEGTRLLALHPYLISRPTPPTLIPAAPSHG
eukprot:768273-Hanusia_phi.AAC.2